MVQVSKHDTELASSLIANAGTRICFRLGDADARKLSEGFSHFTAEDLQSLSPGEAIARVNQADLDFSLSIEPFILDAPHDHTEEIIGVSRARYGKATSNEEPDVPLSQEPHQGDTMVETFEPIASPAPSPYAVPEVAAARQSQHLYYQMLIKKMAEANGYRADIELPTPDGAGKVDVSLEKDRQKLAVEISVTTNAPWELHNIEKCLAAGYNKVFACSNSIAIQTALRRSFPEEHADRVIACAPEGIIQYLQHEEPLAADAPQHVSKGYRVNIQYNEVSAETAENKRAIIEQIIKHGKGKK